MRSHFQLQIKRTQGNLSRRDVYTTASYDFSFQPKLHILRTDLTASMQKLRADRAQKLGAGNAEME